ncbi:MAG TPA: hypothetical protein VMU04_23630 [Candidatus Acidoferrum sp.]|nr:hypothetical protein [Candidatus Acidoferrum sp.]
MTVLRFIGLAVGLSVSSYANPRVAMVHTHAYLASEHVAVTISQTGAQVHATFTFRFEPDRLDYVKEAGRVIVEVPIWLPDDGHENTAVAEFWKTFGTRHQHGLDQHNRHCFYEALAFDASLRGMSLPTGVKSCSSHLDDPEASRVYAEDMHRPEFVTFNSEGAACVVATLVCEGVHLRGDAPLNVSYRQPLIKTSKDHRFVYLPSFYDLPKGVSTADTSRYAIELSAAAGCTLQVSNGDKQYELAPRQKIVLSPRHLQPIRAIVTAGSNKAT